MTILARFGVAWLLLVAGFAAQADQTFLREAGETSVVLGAICVPELGGEEYYPTLDFNTANLVITISSPAQNPGTTFNYTGANIDDGPNSATWGDPPASAIEVDALTTGSVAGCINLHLRDEVLAVVGAAEWTIVISDGGVLIMDHTVYVSAVESVATLVAAIHADLLTGTNIPANLKMVDDDATAAATFEAWIDAAALPADLIKVNGTNAVSAAGRPEVNTTHFGGTVATSSGGRPEVNSTLFGGVAVASATLAGADDAVLAAIAAVETGITWNTTWDAEVESEVLDALVSLELDQLLSTTYNPAAEPASDSLFGDLTESDGGTTRFNANAVEQAPTGAGGDGSAFTAIPWNPAWDLEVQSEATDALNAYDPPTRAELTSDIATITGPITDIQGRLPAALIGGRMNSDTEAVNNVVINGNGTSVPFGP